MSMISDYERGLYTVECQFTIHELAWLVAMINERDQVCSIDKALLEKIEGYESKGMAEAQAAHDAEEAEQEVNQ